MTDPAPMKTGDGRFGYEAAGDPALRSWRDRYGAELVGLNGAFLTAPWLASPATAGIDGEISRTTLMAPPSMRWCTPRS